MNILFIEDERELRESGVAQLELHRYTVYPVSNLADARAVMENPAMPVHLVLADQSLPDGQGIQFVIEMKEQFPHCMYTIVSGCLTDANTTLLDEKEIPYFRKPLLYGNVVEGFRREHVMGAPSREVPVEALSEAAEAAAQAAAQSAAEAVEVPSPESEVPSPESEVPSPESEVPSPEPEVPSPEPEVPSPESEAPKRKKWFGLFGK